MSYFINSDGTIEFVADRYDSAGNISGFKPQSIKDITGGEKYDNRDMYDNFPKGKLKTKKVRVPPYCLYHQFTTKRYSEIP